MVSWEFAGGGAKKYSGKGTQVSLEEFASKDIDRLTPVSSTGVSDGLLIYVFIWAALRSD